VWEWLFSVCCLHAYQALPLRSELANNVLWKQRCRVHFFTLNFECHNRYNKLSMCSPENGDIAWCNKNNSKWGFSVFRKRRTKTCFLIKKQKNVFFKTKNLGGLFFLKKSWFFSTLVSTQWRASLATNFTFFHKKTIIYLYIFNFLSINVCNIQT